MFEYKTHGTCSTQIDLEIEDGVITACTIHNGCRGNTAGLAKMVVGRKADDVKELLRGIPCRGATSCPDQLARAIDAYEQQEAPYNGQYQAKENHPVGARDVRVPGVSDVPVRGRGADEYLLSSQPSQQTLFNCGRAVLCAPV